ncbi:MAG: superoxide dismutase family protein [Cyclobacteriaceae bacterium]
MLLTTLSSCSEDDPSLETKAAKVELTTIDLFGGGVYTLTTERKGEINFTQQDSIVTMTINLSGFPPNGVHAVHIHEGTCEEPALHWNIGVPHMEKFCNKRSLGIPWGKPLAGDVGNVTVGADGTGSLSLKTDLWRIASGDARDLLGKIVVIHDGSEDFTQECDPNHDHTHAHVNPKIACGMIEFIR